MTMSVVAQLKSVLSSLVCCTILTSPVSIPIGEGLRKPGSKIHVPESRDDVTDDESSSVQSLSGNPKATERTVSAVEELSDFVSTLCPENPLMALLNILGCSINPGIASAAARSALARISARWPTKIYDETFAKQIKDDMIGNAAGTRVETVITSAIKASIRECTLASMIEEPRLMKQVVGLIEVQSRLIYLKIQMCMSLLPRAPGPPPNEKSESEAEKMLVDDRKGEGEKDVRVEEKEDDIEFDQDADDESE